jgi:hypothetical protein
VTDRTPAEAIAAVHRHGPPISVEQRQAATALLEDLLAAAARHSVTLEDFAFVADLPGACVDLAVVKLRRG